MFYKTVFLATLISALAGCASVPMGDAAQDAKLKSFAAKPGVAGLYVYRNEAIGAAIRMDVAVDGQPLGRTAAKTYFYTELPPGRHTVTSKSENTDSLEFDADAGKLYYVWQEVKMGWLIARNKLHLVDEAEGKRGVSESQLAVSSQMAMSAQTAANGGSKPATSATASVATMEKSDAKPEAPNVFYPAKVFFPVDPASKRKTDVPVDPKRLGTSSFAVERLGQGQNCGEVPAYLIIKNGTHEEYELRCKDERVLRAACEFRQCQLVQ